MKELLISLFDCFIVSLLEKLKLKLLNDLKTLKIFPTVLVNLPGVIKNGITKNTVIKDRIIEKIIFQYLL